MPPHSLDTLIGTVYEAASGNAAAWPDAARQLGELLGARKTVLFSCPAPGALPTLFSSHNFDPGQIASTINPSAP